MKKYNVGQKVRSYDFKERNDCYIEGTIRAVLANRGLYKIEVETRVWNGQELPVSTIPEEFVHSVAYVAIDAHYVRIEQIRRPDPKREVLEAELEKFKEFVLECYEDGLGDEQLLPSPQAYIEAAAETFRGIRDEDSELGDEDDTEDQMDPAGGFGLESHK